MILYSEHDTFLKKNMILMGRTDIKCRETQTWISLFPLKYEIFLSLAPLIFYVGGVTPQPRMFISLTQISLWLRAIWSITCRKFDLNYLINLWCKNEQKMDPKLGWKATISINQFTILLSPKNFTSHKLPHKTYRKINIVE